MIDFISGKVADINENVVVLENNGIGYEIMVSLTTLVGLTVFSFIFKCVKTVILYSVLQTEMKRECFCA